MAPFLRFFCLTVFMSALHVLPASAQVPPNCTSEVATNPTRNVLKCAGSVIIEMDAAAQLGIADSSDAPPSHITVRKGAVLIDIEPGSDAPQIRTAHAIAAVRGTVFAVEVEGDTTSVFVVKGLVNVKRQRGFLNSVDVGPGEGVDVTQGTPLAVQTWGEPRVRSLLSRFGR